jgi:CheY-like chemotaxis protein
VLIRVEDTGVGMTPAIVDRIFEPFFTTKETGKGTGLGLSTAHVIVKNHGGFIHVYSEVGKGTRFRVYLPAEVSEADSTREALERSPLPRGNGEVVLVVDDEEPIRDVARRTLERYGYRVEVASNGAEAVSRFAQLRGTIAVVLTDMNMPVMDGPSTILALKTIDPHVRIIGSSGLDANGHVAKAVGAGVKHFVPKPYTAEVILRTLQAVLNEG